MLTFIFVQARLGSSRLRGKVLKKVNNLELIKIQHRRLKKIISNVRIIFLIPKNNSNKELEIYLKKNDIEYFLGDEKNVLNRYYQAANKHNAKFIIRLTGDCPLIDPRIIDKMIKLYFKTSPNYLTNSIIRTFPHGMDMEMFNFKTLEKVWYQAKSNYDKEHVTTYIKKNKKLFKPKSFVNNKNLSNYRVTVDYAEDLRVIKKIINNFKPNIYFSSNQIVTFLKKNPKVANLNSMHKIN
jgi:spore coat polysaccharide biosynthesis protein SpsF (cytidylyltransferase family)